MTVPSAAPNPPLPGRLAWFAVWTWFPTWKPWQRWTLAIAVVTFGYALSPIPVLWTAEHFGGRAVRDNVAFTVYLPIVAMCMMAPSLDHQFYQRQDEWLRSVIGDP